MAPRELAKPTTKTQRERPVSKTSVQKTKPPIPNDSPIKKTIISKSTTDKVVKASKGTAGTIPATPNKRQVLKVPSSSIKKSIKKRRPKAAHSGVPVPEKFRKLTQKDLDFCQDV